MSLISESETHILYIFITYRVKYCKLLFLEMLMIMAYRSLKHKIQCLRKLEYYIRLIKKYILNKNVRLLKSILISMYSILGWASFCMNYCINAVWHGGNQPVALLRCNGSPGFFDSGLQVIYIVGSGVSHLPLDNTPEILYGQLCWPIKHSNTMVTESALGTFGSVGRCQVRLENEISISIKLVSRRKY